MKTTSKLTLLGALMVFLAGCLTTPPALGGKTKYSMQFNDTVSEIKDDTGVVVSPGQDTNFSVDITAAAGADVTDLASMRYIVNPKTGEVDIAVASQTAADTTAQAQALVQAHQTTTETYKALTPIITDMVLKSMVPITPVSGAGSTIEPPGPRTVDMSRLLEGLQLIGVNVTLEQANALAELFGADPIR